MHVLLMLDAFFIVVVGGMQTHAVRRGDCGRETRCILHVVCFCTPLWVPCSYIRVLSECSRLPREERTSTVHVCIYLCTCAQPAPSHPSLSPAPFHSQSLPFSFSPSFPPPAPRFLFVMSAPHSSSCTYFFSENAFSLLRSLSQACG